MKSMEEMKKRNEMMDMILDMMAEATGDKKIVCVKKTKKLGESIDEIAMDLERNIPEEKLDELINLIDQFQKMINDFKEDL